MKQIIYNDACGLKWSECGEFSTKFSTFAQAVEQTAFLAVQLFRKCDEKEGNDRDFGKI